MAVNFSTLVYLPNYDMFARSIIVDPIASQPGVPAYTARGIVGTRDIDVQAMDGSIYSDQQTICDIREAEFTVLPAQLDRITIPADVDGGPAWGEYEVTDADTNGGGETTLSIRKVQTSLPS
jgi:hypothetical protein